MNIDFNKYKNYLLDYFKMQNIDVRLNNLTKCPFHKDDTPSFNVFVTKDGTQEFNCFGCGKKGDIYKAVEYCTGETDVKAQYAEIDRIFGTGEYKPKAFTPQVYEEKNTFKVDLNAFQTLTDFLKSQPKAKENILHYFELRAQIKTGGKLWKYPDEIMNKVAQYFLWYPGSKITEQAIGKEAMFASGIPYAKRDEAKPLLERSIAWRHSGIVAKSSEGYKLFYMDASDEHPSKKLNPLSGVSYFPIPSKLPEGKTIVLMEGEIDAILCQCIGIDAFSFGGKSGLTKNNIKKHIIGKNIPEIVLFADNDSDGGSQKKFGLLPVMPSDHIRETIPENLRKLGYTGKIRVCALPANGPYKDSDDAIRDGNFDIIRQTIENAIEYKDKNALIAQNDILTDAEKNDAALYDILPLKFFKSLVKKFPYEEIDPTDRRALFCAFLKSCTDCRARIAIKEWTGNTAEDLELSDAYRDNIATPYDIISIGQKYNVSDYILQKLSALLTPATEILKNNPLKKTIVTLNYEKIDESTLKQFLETKSEHTAAELITQASDGNLMYHPLDKKNYAFNGINWMQLEGLAEPIFNILQNILVSALKKDKSLKNAVNEILKKIGARQYRSNIIKDFNEITQNIFDPNIAKFDSEASKESYTLKDGIIDFSGKKLFARYSAEKTEYRKTVLPYTVDEIMKAKTPQKFLDFINSDFYEPDEKTLAQNPVRTADTLLYALSLIPSRNKKECYGMFFLGEGGTGKSTLCNLMEDIFTGFSYSIPKGVLVAQKATTENPSAATPQIAEFEGKLLAISQETRKNSLLISDVFKTLTAGDSLSARFLHENLRRFNPTAQIIISSNYDPFFDSHDNAVVRRLLVFRFNINHRTNKSDEKFKKITEHLKDEYPAILKFLALRYIDLQQNHAGKVPESLECLNEKQAYVEDQESDVDNFVKTCLKITNYIDDSFVFTNQIYECYLKFFNRDSAETKDILTQKKLTGILKREYKEFKANWKQKRPHGNDLPQWGFQHISFTDLGLEYLQKSQEENLPLNPPSAQYSTAPDEEPSWTE